jgi:hypothetical protein
MLTSIDVSTGKVRWRPFPTTDLGALQQVTLGFITCAPKQPTH